MSKPVHKEIPKEIPKEIKNLLIITIDTVRADTFYASEDNQFSDRLSIWLKRARVYRNAQSVAPWTIPSIATVLTGYAQNQHGAGAFPGAIANLNTQLPSSVLAGVSTLAERLGVAGFSSNAASAHPWFSSGFGLERGFNTIDARKSRKNIDIWFEQSIKQREQASVQQRNFTYLHYMEAHGRHTRNLEEYFSKLSNDQKKRGLNWAGAICENGLEATICQRYLVYNQAVLELRDSLANVLEQLENSGLLEQTLVLVYSDHGEEFHDHLEQAQADNHDPRGIYGFGHGNSLYEEQLHIPLLIWNPNDEKGRIVNTPVSLLDVAPSILDWLGVDISADNFPGMLLDKAEKETDRVFYASNIAYGPEQISVRDGDEKSIWNTVSDKSSYFNLKNDPDEQQPLTGDDLVLHFDKLTGDYLDLASANIGEPPEIDAEQLERLKSIGYLQGSEVEATVKPKPDPNIDLTIEQDETKILPPQTENQ
ncbi:MAG: sulfatase-like hydrolase/transferase [Xanthomonadales bacterium]|nr:sulfatase-like hydrolase/transferase [Xanthomonadales bacterium]